MKKLTISQTTWNLTPLAKNDNDPNIELEKKKVEEESYKFITKWKDREDYLKDPKILKEALDEYEHWCKHYGTSGNFGYYLWLRSTQDQNDPQLKGKINQLEDFSNKIQNDIQFFHIRVSKIPKETQSEILNAPELKEYKHYLEKLFAESRYLLSEPEEKIMNLKSATSHSNWVRMTAGFLAKEEFETLTEEGKREKKSFSEIASMTSSQQQAVRDEAAQHFNAVLAKYVDVAEVEINSILANKKINDDLRGISRPDLTRHLDDDIESEVVDALIEAVSGKFELAQRYYKLKAQLLGKDKLAYHERNVDYGTADKKYTYEEAIALVHTVFKQLDPQFAQLIAEFVENGFVDVYPRKGKRSGAFCAYNLPTQPTYTLLNFTEKLNDVLTIAHEFGHGINFELMKQAQNAINFGTPTSTAEVASTFMEDFVLDEILKTANDELKLSLLMNKLNSDISTISRQIACYRFEQNLHSSFREKGYLSKEDIGTIFRKHMESYMGPAVEQSEGSQNWWVYWSHIRSFFYVYSYSSGLLISKSMQNAVKQDPKFIEKVKEFLSAGSVDSPKNIFMKMGINIADQSFWNKGLQEVENLLNETEKLAKDLKKI